MLKVTETMAFITTVRFNGANGGLAGVPSANWGWTQTLGLQSVEDLAEGIRA